MGARDAIGQSVAGAGARQRACAAPFEHRPESHVAAESAVTTEDLAVFDRHLYQCAHFLCNRVWRQARATLIDGNSVTIRYHPAQFEAYADCAARIEQLTALLQERE